MEKVGLRLYRQRMAHRLDLVNEGTDSVLPRKSRRWR